MIIQIFLEILLKDITYYIKDILKDITLMI